MIEWKDRVSVMILSLIVVAAFCAVCLAMFYLPPIHSEMKELAMLLLGVLAGSFTTIINYWTGSTSSGARKDATIAAALPTPTNPGKQ